MTSTGGQPDLGTRIRTKQGNLIRQVRRTRNMTVADVATALTALGYKTSTAAVSQWESGIYSPRQATQLAIAHVLDVPWLSLFDLTGETL